MRFKLLYLGLLFTCFQILMPVKAQGAASTPVSVSGITCTSGTCTVTTSAVHNIPSTEPGFCLQGGPAADVLCGTVASVPTTTTFTVVSATMATCSTSCGTAQPAKQFLILGDPITNTLGVQQVTACVWNFITTPLPISGATSSCSTAEPNATLLTSENAAIASGVWIEALITLQLAQTDPRAQIEAEFQHIQQARQSEFASKIQPGRDLGAFCDAVGCS